MNYDIIISGGGLLGLITAIGLNNNSISVAVIERNSIPYSSNDNKVFAISYRSKKILEKLGIWELIKNEAEPILDICVIERNNPFTVHYDHRIVCKEPMGYVISNNTILDIIMHNNSFLNKISIYSPHSYKEISCDGGFIQVTLDDNTKLVSSLLICAEGKNSRLPELFSIPIIKFNYKQNSIVFNVEHELHHQNLAVEKFFPGGPFAVLPMKGGYLSSVVWTEKSEISKMLINLSEEQFMTELKKRFGFYLGKIKLHNKREFYPLIFNFAKRIYKERVLIIGDAAHSIHPVAGQGLNLGIRDVESVIKHLSIAKSSGINIGSSYILKKISRDRYFDNFTMALATDGLNRIFSNRMFCTKVLRSIGLMIVENSSFIKRHFVSYAMGL